jgi:hypothetical protein
MAGFIGRGDVIWLIGEILKADEEIANGNKDRYVAGRRVAFASATARLLKVGRSDLDRYLEWVVTQLAEGKRIGALEEPFAWVRVNPA